MKTCEKCGNQAQDNVRFCPTCGNSLGTETTPSADASANPALSAAQDASENKTMGILAYILFFIPLLTGAHKTSPFVKFHTNQGTVLFIATIILSVVYSLLTSIVTSILLTSGSWGLWSAITTILGLVWLVPGVLCIIGIVNAAGGKMKQLPVIGSITIIK